MAGILNKNDVETVDVPDEADIIIMNTCYVKHPTEQKVLTKIQRMKSRFPDKKLVISGCMVEIDPEKLDKLAPEASWIYTHKIQSTYDVVESVCKGRTSKINRFFHRNKGLSSKKTFKSI